MTEAPSNIVSLEERRKKRAAERAEEEEMYGEDGEEHEILCNITIRASGKISVFVNHEVCTTEQYNWIYGQIAAATAEVLKIEAEDEEAAASGDSEDDGA